MVYYEGKLILYGTSDIYKNLSSEKVLFVYDLEVLAWNEIITEENANMTTFHKVKIEGKSMYVYFGYNGYKPNNIVKKLDLDSYSWEIVGEIDNYFLQDYSICYDGSFLYIIYSKSEEEAYAPIMLIDIAKNPTNIIENCSKS